MPDASVSAHEQLMLEFVNRARLDPLAEAMRLGATNISSLGLPTVDLAPLAGNAHLALSSAVHSEWMLNTDRFSHTGANGSSAGDRMASAGYVFSGSWSWGENLAYRTSSGTLNVTQSILDLHRALFFSDGHRTNILSTVFREIGIGQEFGIFDGRNATTITQNYALSGPALFLTGVVYDDLDGNGFYSIGEGRGGVIFSTATGSSTSAAAGGYAATMTAGAQLVTLQLPSGTQNVIRLDSVTGNVKLDLVDSDLLLVSTSATLISGIANLQALGTTDLSLAGNDAANLLIGNSGDNRFAGGGGNDTIIGGGGTDVAVIHGNPADISAAVTAESVSITGPQGTAVYIGISYFEIDGELFDADGLLATIAANAVTDDVIVQIEDPEPEIREAEVISGIIMADLPDLVTYLARDEDTIPGTFAWTLTFAAGAKAPHPAGPAAKQADAGTGAAALPGSDGADWPTDSDSFAFHPDGSAMQSPPAEGHALASAWSHTDRAGAGADLGQNLWRMAGTSTETDLRAISDPPPSPEDFWLG